MEGKDSLEVAGRRYPSRLIVGTGKYKDLATMKAALEASGAAMVTVAVRRVDLKDRSAGSFYDHLPKGMEILPNTAGCYTAEEAIRCARIARELLDTPLIKLEVIGDPRTLLPDTAALVAATETLAKEDFIVMPYTNDDPVAAKKLLEAGAACVMPLAAPIGSGQGILNRLNLGFVLEVCAGKAPVIVDAGVGVPSDAAAAMEMGADGVLMNTAIAEARDPVRMARAMRLAVEAGRLSFLAGRMEKRSYASASSPTAGISRPGS